MKGRKNDSDPEAGSTVRNSSGVHHLTTWPRAAAGKERTGSRSGEAGN